LQQVRRAGLSVHLHVDGEPVTLPRALDLSAYRIVQEGVTNVLKHAQASEAMVTVGYGSDELHIEVRDNGNARDTGGRSGPRPRRCRVLGHDREHIVIEIVRPSSRRRARNRPVVSIKAVPRRPSPIRTRARVIRSISLIAEGMMTSLVISRPQPWLHAAPRCAETPRQWQFESRGRRRRT